MTTTDNNKNELATQDASAKKPMTLKAWLRDPGLQTELQKVSCGIVTGERLASVALNCLVKTPKLLACSTATLVAALKTLAAMGCEPDGIHGYLVPHKGKDGVTTATPIPSARGLLRMARANGIKNVNIGVVREGEAFDWKLAGGKFTMLHEPTWGGSAPVIGYFVTWCDKDSYLHGTRMTREEVEAIRQRSRSANEGPWVTDFDQMALKTVIKRAAKQWDLPVTALAAMQAADESEFADMRDVTPRERAREEALARLPRREEEMLFDMPVDEPKASMTPNE